jgi:hypothetical protein
MSEDPAAITFRVIQELMPEYHIPPDLLNGVFAAIPPPPAAATAAWRHARVTRVIEEVAARVPMDAAQGHLAAQIAVFQFMADGLAAQIHAPGLDMLEMYRLTRLMDALAQTVARLERSLERRQFRVMPFRDVRAVDGFDLDAMDAIWCRREPADGPLLGAGPVGNLVGNSASKLVGSAVGSAVGSPVGSAVDNPVGNRVDNPVGNPVDNPVDNPVGNPVESPVGNPVENPAGSPRHHETAAPGSAVGEQDAVARPAEPAPGRATTERVEPRAETAAGGPAASATVAAEGPPTRPSIPSSGGVARVDGVTVEQGDGWTLEVWPARPGARAGAGAAEPDGQPGRDPWGDAENDGAAAWV